MADIKFSEFPKANQSKDTDELAILQDGVNKMIPSPVLESKIINKTVSRVIEQGGSSLNVVNLKGVVPTYADLALITPTPELNDAYQVEADGLVYVYTENGFQADGDGFVVQADATGVVEEGNTQAVSGGEVYDVLSEFTDESYNLINYKDIEATFFSINTGTNKVTKTTNLNRIGVELKGIKSNTTYNLIGFGEDSTSAKKVIFANNADDVLGYQDAISFTNPITTPVGTTKMYINIATATNIGVNPTETIYSSTIQLTEGADEKPYKPYGRTAKVVIEDKSISLPKITDDLLNKIADDVISTKNFVYNNNVLTWLAIRNGVGFDSSTIYRYNLQGDLENYQANTSVIRMTNTNELVDVNKGFEISFSVDIDISKNEGALIGFSTGSESSPANSFYVGYEPAHTAIEIYYNGEFYKIVDAPVTGSYDIKIIKNGNSSVVVNVNGVYYPVSNYVAVDLSNMPYLRMHTKQTDAGMVIRNLKASYMDSESSSTDADIKRYSNNGAIIGKNVHIYHFGGKGNDWCFVRTPENYDPQREKPYPFVICNHGNGWTMNGTLARANFSEKTQFGVDTQNDGAYLDTGNPYYVQYSNETIERLLEAGYIVCGAQNYADGLYGNNDCRNAVVDFYQHMIKSYNVETKCSMLGASNGAMTCLNAMYLLGGVNSVKSMILYYPLTCLWNHYNGYAPHQSGIEAAYGISSGLTESEFESQTRTHDPERVNTIISGTDRIKTTSLPPIKFSYSLDDTVTPASLNSLPLIQVLEDSNAIYETFVATGQHGDYTHFNPVEDVQFIEKYN